LLRDGAPVPSNTRAGRKSIGGGAAAAEVPCAPAIVAANIEQRNARVMVQKVQRSPHMSDSQKHNTRQAILPPDGCRHNDCSGGSSRYIAAFLGFTYVSIQVTNSHTV
jgi:hypothetical protein